MQVGLAMVSIIVTGGVAGELLAAGASLGAVAEGAGLSLAFDIDQLTTNEQGSSLVERTVLKDNPTAKAVYNAVQFVTGSVSKSQNLIEIGKNGATPFQAIDQVNSTINSANDAVQAGENVIEAQKK